MLLGLDYASVDGNTPPDFAAAKAAGCSFVYIRGAWGTYRDPHLARDADNARKAGLTVGSYLFLRYPEQGAPAPSPVDQADTFMGAYSYLYTPGDLPPVVDIEFPHGIGATVDGSGHAPMWPQQALGWIKAAVDRIDSVGVFGAVGVYTSARVWAEDMANVGAGPLADCPLWVKTPYIRRAREPFPAGLDDVGHLLIPPPWHGRAWIQQFQGDALGFPGFSSTVDVNRFIPFVDGPGQHADPRADWVHARLAGRGIRAFQEANGLVSDGVVGPKTFSALCRVRV